VSILSNYNITVGTLSQGRISRVQAKVANVSITPGGRIPCLVVARQSRVCTLVHLIMLHAQQVMSFKVD
jgi:hypothetical protein